MITHVDADVAVMPVCCDRRDTPLVVTNRIGRTSTCPTPTEHRVGVYIGPPHGARDAALRLYGFILPLSRRSSLHAPALHVPRGPLLLVHDIPKKLFRGHSALRQRSTPPVRA